MARDLAEMWRLYADTGAGADAPTYRAIAHMVAGDEALLDIVRETPPETHHPNHLFAAARFLMLGGLEHPLAAAYVSGSLDDACSAFRAFVTQHRTAVVDVLQTRRVQTNEVGRVGVIAPALAHARRRVDMPLGLVEVGASAGLNLLVDQCRVDYGEFSIGRPHSPLALRCDCAATPPPFSMGDLDISWRIGLDRSPIHPDDEADSRWLLACVWIDQPDRIERLAAALSMARASPSPLVAGDAVTGLASVVARVPDHLHLVVLTSWVAFYLSREQRVAFEEVLAHVGRPVTWISLEHPGVVRDLDLSQPPPDQLIAASVVAAVSFDDGAAVAREVWAWAHPHGRWLDWRAGPT